MASMLPLFSVMHVMDKKMYRKFLVCACISVCFFFHQNYAFSDESYEKQLLSRADQVKLYDDSYWKVLLHYRKNFWGAERSLIDDPNFFLSPDGKTTPRSELRETIKGFFQEQPEGAQHPQCRFVARYNWLREKLNFDDSKLPKVTCADHENFVRKINPQTAFLVFPSAYANAPTSLFGHTLIRLERSDQSLMLSYSINYAASAKSGGVGFIFKSIFGGYKGYYSVLPFHEKIKEYNDLEQRDIWEYRLNLTEAELRRMIDYAWELKDIYSYYYFLDANCSSMLLYLLDAARPSLNLTQRHNLWVIPIDTIRQIVDSRVVESYAYRPSEATKIKYIASGLIDSDSKIVAEIIKDNFDLRLLEKGSNEGEMRNLLSKIAQYQYMNGKISNADYLKVISAISVARNTFDAPKADEKSNVPVPAAPEKGHKSNMVWTGIGDRNGNLFLEIGFRPAYHTLLDPDEGYSKGSQISLFDISMRYYYQKDLIRLNRFELLNIAAILPRETFFKPTSWFLNTGVETRTFRNKEDHLAYYLQGGMGAAYDDKSGGIYYLLLKSDIGAGGSFRDDFSAGVGVSCGFLKNITDNWKLNITLEALPHFLGDNNTVYSGTVAQNIKINNNNSLTLAISKTRTYNVYSNESSLNWNLYF